MDLDLKPNEYRRKGWLPPLPHPLDNKWLLRLGIACGMWAGAVIGVCRYFVSGDNPLVVAAIALIPGAIWGVWLILSDRP